MTTEEYLEAERILAWNNYYAAQEALRLEGVKQAAISKQHTKTVTIVISVIAAFAIIFAGITGAAQDAKEQRQQDAYDACMADSGSTIGCSITKRLTD